MTIIQQTGDTTLITLNGATAVRGALNGPSTSPSDTYGVHNGDTTAACYVRFGDSTVTATTTGLVVPPLAYIGIEAGAGVTHASVIAAGAATGTVSISPIRCQGRF